jgi:hypothetical protein
MVKRRLNEVDFFGRVAIKKPLLCKQNKRKRLEWGRKHHIGQFSNGKKSSGPMNPNSRSLDPKGVHMFEGLVASESWRLA